MSAPRAVIRWFAQAMEDELKENDHKGGWADMHCKALMARLLEELIELQGAIEQGASKPTVLSEAADVANFAMMVADNYCGGK